MAASRARTMPGDFIDRLQAAEVLGLAYAEAIYRVRRRRRRTTRSRARCGG
jgi:hypothetical protein